MCTPEFYDSKVNKDPQNFINKVYRIMVIMSIPLEEKVELVACQLEGVARMWYD